MYVKPFANDAKDCVLRLVEIERNSLMNDHDEIIHRAFMAFQEIQNKIRLKDLALNERSKDDIYNMDIVINGYIRRLEILYPDLIIPINL